MWIPGLAIRLRSRRLATMLWGYGVLGMLVALGVMFVAVSREAIESSWLPLGLGLALAAMVVVVLHRTVALLLALGVAGVWWLAQQRLGYPWWVTAAMLTFAVLGCLVALADMDNREIGPPATSQAQPQAPAKVPLVAVRMIGWAVALALAAALVWWIRRQSYVDHAGWLVLACASGGLSLGLGTRALAHNRALRGLFAGHQPVLHARLAATDEGVYVLVERPDIRDSLWLVRYPLTARFPIYMARPMWGASQPSPATVARARPALLYGRLVEGGWCVAVADYRVYLPRAPLDINWWQGTGELPAWQQPLRSDAVDSHRLGQMVRPESWIRPAGVSPVWVGTGAPSSRPRFVVERWRAERGVESLCGGSKNAGRSVKRILQPRHSHNGGAEPLISRRRPCLVGPVPGLSLPGPSGVGEVARVHGLVRNRRGPSVHALSGERPSV